MWLTRDSPKRNLISSSTVTSSAAWTRIEERANRKPEPGKRHRGEHAELRELIFSARQQIGQTVNRGVTEVSA